MATPNGAPGPGRGRRRLWQRRLFGALGVVWLVIGLLVGVAFGRWTIAGLWFALAAMELTLWVMAGRR